MLLIGLFACTGAPEPPPPPTDLPATLVPPAVVEGTWAVRLADDAARAPFEGAPGWSALFEGRPADAVVAFAADPAGRGRAHAELAAVYAQAATLGARATVAVWGDDPQPGDPAEAPCVVAMARALLGGGRTPGLGGCGKSPDAGLVGVDRAWAAWDGGAVDGPAAAGAEGLPVAPGAVPDPGERGRWRLAETPPGTGTVEVADPGLLYALARAHLAAAADPWAPAIAAAFGPPGPAPALPAGDAPDAALFLSFAGSADDLRWLATGGAAGEGGALAAVARACATTTVDPACFVGEADAYAAHLVRAMGVRSDGPRDFHRAFADRLAAGVLWAGLRLADARGDSDAAGRLRLALLERAEARVADPLVPLVVAAWDVGNRNTLRATELFHRVVDRAPGLPLARVPLDALHVRVARSAAPAAPLH